MALVKWTPMKEIRDLQREMSRVFGRPFVSLFEEPSRELTGFGPTMDVYSKDNDLIVRVEMPGMKAEDLDISLSEHTLTISGERKEDKEVKEEDFYRRESSYGRFERTLPLPEKITESDIDASYEDGILEVKVKGAVEEEPVKKIEVKTKGEKQVIEGPSGE
ncbi:MAG: Hsp20/alpha crystallin family protein [Thermoleophilia bacterium]|nr:Hsp20/alpha crystallin family protein [Thermoleophilia bacterium]